jgi:hypothetical protein
VALKKQNTRLLLNLSLFLLILSSLLFNPISALALGNSAALPTFTDFSKSVQDGQKDVVRGVYADKVLAFPIVQQPSGNAGYVSNKDGSVTQFGMASQFGNIGLLAHNNLAGKFFSQLTAGQEIRLVYGDGHVEYFVVKEVLKFQALQPTSMHSSFKNLDKDETLTAEQMFKRVYTGDRHVTFQTCIEANGQLSWGRLFVIAVPKEKSLAFSQLSQ